MNTVTRRLLAVLCVAGVLTAAGCGEDEAAPEPAGEGPSAAAAAVQAPADIADAGELRFCTDPTYPPAEFMEGSEFAGFDIEIAREIAGSMGVEAAFVQTGFDGIIAAVQAGKCDALIAAMNITPEREEAIAFVPYGKTGHGLMVASGNPEGLRTLDDLSGHAVAVQVGTTQKEAIEEENKRLEEAGQPGIDVQTFPKDTEAAAALQAGRVDAYFADGPPIAYYVQRNPDRFEIAATNLSSAPIGIGIKKDNAELIEAMQAAVDRLYDSGRMEEILGKWDLADVAL